MVYQTNTGSDGDTKGFYYYNIMEQILPQEVGCQWITN